MLARLLKTVRERDKAAFTALLVSWKGVFPAWGGILAASAAASIALHLAVLGLVQGLVLFQGPRAATPPAFAASLFDEHGKERPETRTFTKLDTRQGPRYVVPAREEAPPQAPDATTPVPLPAPRLSGGAPSPVQASQAVWEQLLASPPAAFSFFGLTGRPATTVFLIDVSGSMLQKTGAVTRLRRANEEIMRAIASLDGNQSFNIVLFADRVDTFKSSPVAATQANKIAAFRYLDSEIDCGGGTNLEAGLATAVAMAPDTIMLLSDGESTTDPTAILAQVRYMREHSRSRMVISTVGFYLDGGSEAEKLLKDVADQSGGRYVRWNNPR